MDSVRPWQPHLAGIRHFRSYAEFEAALNKYCKKNAVAGAALKFVHHSSTKLEQISNMYGIGKDIIDRFVYDKLTLRCIYHKSMSSKNGGPYCQGEIGIRYDCGMNALEVVSFHTHSQHRKINHLQQLDVDRDVHLKKIFKIAPELSDSALALLVQLCEYCHSNDRNNAGERDVILPIENEPPTLDPGAFEYNSHPQYGILFLKSYTFKLTQTNQTDHKITTLMDKSQSMPPKVRKWKTLQVFRISQFNERLGRLTK